MLVDHAMLYKTTYMSSAFFQLLQNNGQISGLNEKADEPIAGVNGHCEKKVVAEGKYTLT